MLCFIENLNFAKYALLDVSELRPGVLQVAQWRLVPPGLRGQEERGELGEVLVRVQVPPPHRVLDSAGVLRGGGGASGAWLCRACLRAPPLPRRWLRRLPRPRALAPRPARLAPARPLRFLSRFAPASRSLQRGAGKMAARGGGAGGPGSGSGPSAGTAGEAVEPALRPGEVAALHPQEVAARLQRMRRELSNRRKILVKNLPQDSSSQVWAPGRGDRAGIGDTATRRNPGWSRRLGEEEDMHAEPLASTKQSLTGLQPVRAACWETEAGQGGAARARSGGSGAAAATSGLYFVLPPVQGGVVGEGARRAAEELRFRGLASGAPREGKGSRVGCWGLGVPRGRGHAKAGRVLQQKHLTKFV